MTIARRHEGDSRATCMPVCFILRKTPSERPKEGRAVCALSLQHQPIYNINKILSNISLTNSLPTFPPSHLPDLRCVGSFLWCLADACSYYDSAPARSSRSGTPFRFSAWQRGIGKDHLFLSPHPTPPTLPPPTPPPFFRCSSCSADGSVKMMAHGPAIRVMHSLRFLLLL